jgi:single-strand DNA-binding protein
MASLNKVMLIGNIGNAPECRTMPNGDSVAHFRLATTEGWMDRASKERKEHTEWHSVVCYRQQADFVRDFLGKGRQIYVEGILRTRKWADKQGIERYTTEIRVDSVQPLGPRPDGVGGSASNDRAGQGKGNEAPPAGGFLEGADDDLPY